MKCISTILLCCLFGYTSYSYNPFWVNMDKKLIQKLAKVDRNNPKAAERFFQSYDHDTSYTNLGFGWKMHSTGAPGGYICITATFVYYHDSIVSYTITPGMPDETGLGAKYRKWYQPGFTFISDSVLPYQFNLGGILHPIAAYPGTLSNELISSPVLRYMSPASGLRYGFVGGASGNMLQNRKAYLDIKHSLTHDQVIAMMYAINPVSRLTAIEYYYQNKDSFRNQEQIEQWIETVYKEIPKVETMSGCIVRDEDARTLVWMYSGGAGMK